MSENILRSLVGDKFYSQCVDHIDVGKRPSLTYSGEKFMPGEQSISQIPMIGDTRIASQIMPGSLTEVSDIPSIAKHYLKGLRIKRECANALRDVTKVVINEGDHANCALGYGLVRHYFVDEFGLSLTTSDPFPDYIVEACTTLMLRRLEEFDKTELGATNDHGALNLDDYLRVRASYPRGKNSGVPLIVSGRNRIFNDAILATNAMLAAAIIRSPSQLLALSDGLLLAYTVFSRFQRTSKIVPFHDGSRPFLSNCFEPRRRVVNATPKFMAMAVKPLVKWWTTFALATPEFTNDRKEIQRRINGACTTFASDASRFDLRSGGVKLRQALDIMWLVAKRKFSQIPESVYDIMIREAFLPTMVDYGFPQHTLFLSDKDALRSGASTTSRAGSLVNLMYDMLVESRRLGTKDPDAIVRYYVAAEPSIILGDDLLKVPKADDGSQGLTSMEGYVSAMDVLKDVGMSAEIEVPTAFLGYTVGDGSPGGRGKLMHKSNPFDNMFFPERFNSNPLGSFLCRFEILLSAEAELALTNMARLMTDEAFCVSRTELLIKKIGPWLESHFSDHPNGAARMFYSRLKSQLKNPSRAWVSVNEQPDEILDYIAKGASYDFNFANIGLPHLNDLRDESQDVLALRLDESGERALTDVENEISRISLASRTTGRRVTNASESKMAVILSRLRDVLKSGDEKKLVKNYRAILPQVGRRVITDAGEVYVGNL